MKTYGDPDYKGHVVQVFTLVVRSHHGVDTDSIGNRMTKVGSLTVEVSDPMEIER